MKYYRRSERLDRGRSTEPGRGLEGAWTNHGTRIEPACAARCWKCNDRSSSPYERGCQAPEAKLDVPHTAQYASTSWSLFRKDQMRIAEDSAGGVD